MSKPRRVLILSASAGTGHLRAAAALAAVCRERADIAQVEDLDALTCTNALFRKIYADLYLRMIHHTPTLLGWFYENTDEPWKTNGWRLLFDRLNTQPLVRRIRDFKPDVTLCTHFLPAQLIAHLIRFRRLETQLGIVVTDYDAHAMWLSPIFHRYFVGLEEARVHLTMMGLPGERISVTGIPIDPLFAKVKSRDALRRKHGLPLDKPVVLVSGGALGVSSAEQMVRILGHMRTPATLAVICGRSDDLRERVGMAIAEAQNPLLDFRAMGYTTEMDEWMKLSDVFIGKPGGLTTSEAMACGLPMVVFGPIPGQEERNSDHLLERGAAVRCNQLTTLAYKVDLLLQDPPRLAAMRRAALALGRPRAAQEVVDAMLGGADDPAVRVSRQLRRFMRKRAGAR